jgi:hypothetical protein
MNAVSGEELVERAREFYKEHLKAQLEPDHVGELVMIDPEAGLWAIGGDALQQHAELQAKGSRGLVVELRVGYDWTVQMLRR